MHFHLAKHTAAPPLPKTPWRGALPKIVSAAVGSSTVMASPDHFKSIVLTVDEASELVLKTMSALEVRDCVYL